VGRSYLIGGYKLPSFFATCKIKDEIISTKSLTKYSSFKRYAIDLVVSRPQRTFHTLNAFIAQSLAKVYILAKYNQTHDVCVVAITKLRSLQKT